MENNGSNINDLLNGNQKLSSQESTMVDSIINDLNTKEKTTQEKLPQISEEEREILMKQRAYQEQQNRQRQMQLQQQQIQQQQLQQQQQMATMYSSMNGGKNKDMDLMSRVKDYLTRSIDVIIVLVLSIVFNMDTFSEFLKFKSSSIFYDIQKDKATTVSIFIKGFIIALTYAIIKYFIK